MSWYTIYRAVDGKTLLGGVLDSCTSRFQTRADLNLRIESIKDVHPGRKIHFDTRESDLPPEIFYHCDDAPATCVGCRCAGCKKLLTEKDAEAAERGDMDPNETLKKIDDALEARRDHEFVDQWCRDLLEWLDKGGFEPDWEKYGLGTSYFKCRKIAERRRK